MLKIILSSEHKNNHIKLPQSRPFKKIHYFQIIKYSKSGETIKIAFAAKN